MDLGKASIEINEWLRGLYVVILVLRKSSLQDSRHTINSRPKQMS